MMLEDKEYQERLFKAFITMLSNTVLQHLGKVVNPFSGQIEQDFEAAKATLGILEMLAIKTKGNLTPEEEDLITKAERHLQLNYAEEVREEKKDGMENKDTKAK